jgi:hypothetical protein
MPFATMESKQHLQLKKQNQKNGQLFYQVVVLREMLMNTNHDLTV